jgi:hypothetical protein
VATASAIATQCVCGRACRGVRDRKLARERRSGDRDGPRADECARQRASRDGVCEINCESSKSLAGQSTVERPSPPIKAARRRRR